jgi:FkbM family methyltransferase
MIAKVKRAVAASKGVASLVGWRWAMRERACRVLGVEEVMVSVRSHRGKVAVRMGTPDMYEFNHLLGDSKTPLNVPGRPEYIVDAGANVGYSALRFKLDHPQARIVALEPEPSNVKQFRKNCGGYPDIVVEQAALWPVSTRLRIANPDAGQNSFQVEDDPNGDVVALTVNDIMKRHSLPRIDVLKIDIEGSEKNLFSGNVDWLDHVSVLLIETHDRMVPGCTAAIEAAVAGKFEARGVIDEYSCYVRH